MKKLRFMVPGFLALALVLLCLVSNAQNGMRLVYLPGSATLHFVSPEPIQYVDISTKALEGDLPIKNVLRLRLRDSLRHFSEAIITIAGEKFMAQYKVVPDRGNSPAQINIEPVDTRPLDIAGISLSQNQLKRIALDLISRKAAGQVKRASAFKMKGQVNQVYAFDDYIFLDVSFKNKTNLNYAIEGLRFKVDDQKVTKASNVQSVELRPVFTLIAVPSFAKSYRNIFVLKKLSFPGNKVLHVELSEQQPSGRIITLGLSYQDILSADPLPN
jgi:conjugative transposon TraN protein